MPTPARIKFIGRDWCGHCTKFKKTWEELGAMVGSGDKKYLVVDFKGFSPVGYFPSFTVNGDASMGESFGRHMRDYSKPVSERIDAAMSDASDPSYRATLEILKEASEGPSGGISEFIGAGAGSSYGYGYKSNSYGY